MSDLAVSLAADEFTGRRLGKYEIACRLSTGGMSEIFLAFQRGVAGFRKFVVLKRILENISGQEDFVRMFVQEAKITALFSHAHIAQVFDLDVAEGELFLAMEFIPGVTLVDVARSFIGRGEAIPIGLTLAVVRDTASALHYAHHFTDPAGRRVPVLHRDIAEKNVMVTFDGVTKLLDFGIAKRLDRADLTFAGTVKGTCGYMSPEQVRGEKLDPRSDVFSLGIVLHECLVGQRLFHRKSRDEELAATLRQEIPLPSRQNPKVTRALDEVVLTALARDRERRFASARDFGRALEQAAGPFFWEREQMAEVVERRFADHRDALRRLLSDPVFEQEPSGMHPQLSASEVTRCAPLPPPPPLEPQELTRTLTVAPPTRASQRTRSAESPAQPNAEQTALSRRAHVGGASGLMLADDPQRPSTIAPILAEEPRTILSPPEDEPSNEPPTDPPARPRLGFSRGRGAKLASRLDALPLLGAHTPANPADARELERSAHPPTRALLNADPPTRRLIALALALGGLLLAALSWVVGRS